MGERGGGAEASHLVSHDRLHVDEVKQNKFKVAFREVYEPRDQTIDYTAVCIAQSTPGTAFVLRVASETGDMIIPDLILSFRTVADTETVIDN